MTALTTAEPYLLCTQLASLLSVPVDSNTVRRWITDGIQDLEGNLVHLEGRRIGRRWYSTRTALERFLQLVS
jgi:hypothetical protein